MIYFHSCIGLDHEPELIPHFLQHYLNLGIPPDQFLLILNTRLGSGDKYLNMLRKYGINGAVLWNGKYSAPAMHVQKKLLLKQHLRPNDWVVHADLDEFHEYPGDLSSMLRNCDHMGANAIMSTMIDRVAPKGRIKTPVGNKPILEQYPLECDITGEIKCGHWTKMMAYKLESMSNIGNHGPELGNPDVTVVLPEEGKDLKPGGYRQNPKITFEQRRKMQPRVNHICRYEFAQLGERIEYYKELGLTWHNESERLLRHWYANDGINLKLYDTR